MTKKLQVEADWCSAIKIVLGKELKENLMDKQYDIIVVDTSKPMDFGPLHHLISENKSQCQLVMFLSYTETCPNLTSNIL